MTQVVTAKRLLLQVANVSLWEVMWNESQPPAATGPTQRHLLSARKRGFMLTTDGESPLTGYQLAAMAGAMLQVANPQGVTGMVLHAIEDVRNGMNAIMSDPGVQRAAALAALRKSAP